MKTTARTIFALAAALAAAAHGETGGLVLWPGPETEMRAQTDSAISFTRDGGVLVETGVVTPWPGVRMDFLAGEKNLESYGAISITVSNVSDHVICVRLSAKCRTKQGRNPDGRVILEPFAQGNLVVGLKNIPWEMSEEVEFSGMAGYPGIKGGSTYDVRHATSFHIYVSQTSKPHAYIVKKVEMLPADDHKNIVLDAKTFFPFVDEFGQFKHGDWPGKIHSLEELVASHAREEADLSSRPDGIAGADRFGGWKDGPRFQATGLFRTMKHEGRWWLVDPDGYLFFSHGVDCVAPGDATGYSHREKYFTWVPGKDDPDYAGCWTRQTWDAGGFYRGPGRVPFDMVNLARANMFKKYGRDWKRIYADLAHRRIRSWGLNTIANWSDREVCSMRRTPYTYNMMYSGGGRGLRFSPGDVRFADPFDGKFAANVGIAAKKTAKVLGDDPWCIGIFVDNELNWGNADNSLANAILSSPANQPAKVNAREYLEKKYGTIGGLNDAWKTKYKSWDAFMDSVETVKTPESAEDRRELHYRTVCEYYRVVSQAIHGEMPGRLYLGSRIAWGGASVFRAASHYCDVVSMNTYSHILARDLPEGSLDRPMLVGEFHFGALDRGLFHTGLAACESQTDRAESYKSFVRNALDGRRWVGVHWFQWRDQPLTARPDGENYQIGFVTVCDTPYPELIAASREIGATMYQRRFAGSGGRK